MFVILWLFHLHISKLETCLTSLLEARFQIFMVSVETLLIPSPLSSTSYPFVITGAQRVTWFKGHVINDWRGPLKNHCLQILYYCFKTIHLLMAKTQHKDPNNTWKPYTRTYTMKEVHFPSSWPIFTKYKSFKQFIFVMLNKCMNE